MTHLRTKYFSTLLAALVMAAATTAFAQPALAAGPQDAGIDNVQEVEAAVDEVLEDASLEIATEVKQTLADASELEIDPDAADVVEFETDDGAQVAIPQDADAEVVLENESGTEIEVSLPGDGEAAEVTEDGSVVYESVEADSDLIVQAQEEGGVRMMVVIDGDDAPTIFDFPVESEDLEQIEVLEDGSATLVGADSEILDVVPAPWAYDAAGNEVPSWYTVEGDSLILNVDHSAAEAYPVVADPCWSCWASTAWNITKCAAAIGVAIGVSVAFANWVVSVGGATAAAQLLWGATFVGEKIFAVAGFFTGVDAVISACGG